MGFFTAFLMALDFAYFDGLVAFSEMEVAFFVG